MTMRFSDAEKLGLLMICDMYKKTVGRGEFDPDFVAEAVKSDFLWALNLAYPGMKLASETPREVHEVGEILAMWSLLEKSYRALNNSQRDQLIVRVTNYRLPVKFPGFDKTSEMQFHIATFFIKKMRKWNEFINYDLDSRQPVMAAYRRMLPLFTRHQAAGAWSLNVNEIADLLNAI